MKEELIEKLMKWVEQAETFAVAEIPQVIQELLIFHLAQSILILCIGFCVGGFFLWAAKECRNEYKKHKCDDVQVAMWVCTILGLIIIILATGIQGYWILMITVAPRLYLLEYFSKLLS
jgi:hypothetical protein